MDDTKMKAYKAYLANYWEAGSTVVFAKSAREAKKAAWMCESFYNWDYEYIDVRVRRLKGLDSAYRGKREMDWDDPEDRLALVKAGWTCFEDFFDPDDCKECSGREFCSMHKDYLKDVEEENDNGNAC